MSAREHKPDVRHRDLREWLDGIESLGELKRLHGAHWDREIGAVSSLYERHLGGAALLFDEVPDHRPADRVLTNTLMSNRRIAYTLGADPNSSALELVDYWRTVSRDLPLEAVRVVDDGPVNENVQDGDDVDLLRFPTPRWHEHDGGRYIGTGCVVVMHDPDTEWINVGTYRVMLHDERHVGLYISPGKHGRLIRERWWSRGEPCPVSISLGQDMLLTALGGIEVPYGKSEYEVAGGLRGEGNAVLMSDITGLPIPASAEIVIEGFLHEGDERDEGPFGEWTGYYVGGRKPAPVLRVERVRHRDDPILLGVLTGRPPTDDTYYRGVLRSALIWDQLAGAGIPGVTGVWVHEASGGRLWVNVSVQQMYAGHAKQVGLVASQCHAGAYANRFVVVVDDDIDVANANDITWALCTRMDPAEDMTVLKGSWSSGLDPMAYPSDTPSFNSRVVIDACRPWLRRSTFPAVIDPPADLKAEVIAKWRDVLPEIAL